MPTLQIPEINVSASPTFEAGGNNFAGGDGGVSNTTNAALNFQRSVQHGTDIGRSLGQPDETPKQAMQQVQAVETLTVDTLVGTVSPRDLSNIVASHDPIAFVEQNTLAITNPDKSTTYFNAPTPFIIPPAGAVVQMGGSASAEDWGRVTAFAIAEGALLPGLAGNPVGTAIKMAGVAIGAASTSGSAFVRVGTDIIMGSNANDYAIAHGLPQGSMGF